MKEYEKFKVKEENEIETLNLKDKNELNNEDDELSKELNSLLINEKDFLSKLQILEKFIDINPKLNLNKFSFDDSFIENLGDNSLRYYIMKILEYFEIVDEYYFAHYDIKDSKFLIYLNLKLKISDSVLLKKEKEKDLNKIEIPGGSDGNLSSNYNLKEQVSKEQSSKQDYFTLLSLLFFVKLKKKIFKFEKYEDKISISDENVDFIERQIMYIKSRQLLDQDFINFIINLIEPAPGDSSVCKQIYRSKWLNKNKEVINDIFSANDNDEEKLIMELQKSDFLIEKRKDSIKKKEKRFKFVKKDKAY